MEAGSTTSTNRSSRSCKWRPTSKSLLEQTESKILKCLNTEYESMFITLPSTNHRIRTLIFNPGVTNKEPLVMVHGFGGGVAMWILNLDKLAKDRTVYVFDLLGFGRSDRPSFSKKPERAENQFVESIEEWRKELKLEKFILFGHSLGAFVSSAYALKYHDHVSHLILADAWGFSTDKNRNLPLMIKVVATLIQPFNPLSIIRVAGPWGPNLVKKARPDLEAKFAHLFDDSTITDYIYHCNVRTPSGESAMKSLSTKFGTAKNPMVLRIGDLPEHIPMTLIHGNESWLKREFADDIKNSIRTNSYVSVQVIDDAGHHLYADEADEFNKVMTQAIHKVEEGIHIAGHT